MPPTFINNPSVFAGALLLELGLIDKKMDYISGASLLLFYP